MPETNHCAECGTPLPAYWPKGLCAQCALDGALDMTNAGSQVHQPEAPTTPAGLPPPQLSAESSPLVIVKAEAKRCAAESRFIPGAFNYCDRWCERCRFTQRCRTYAMLEKQGLTDPNIEAPEFWESLRQTFQSTKNDVGTALRQHGNAQQPETPVSAAVSASAARGGLKSQSFENLAARGEGARES